MKPLIMLILSIGLALNYSEAQTLSPTVVSSSGVFYQNAAGMISSTIGEMTMVETFANGNAILTQGFQQSLDIDVGIQVFSSAASLVVFPNPTSGNTTILLPSGFSEDLELHVFDALGKLVISRTLHIDAAMKNIHLSLEGFTDGVYMLEVNTRSAHFFSKINLTK